MRPGSEIMFSIFVRLLRYKCSQLHKNVANVSSLFTNTTIKMPKIYYFSNLVKVS